MVGDARDNAILELCKLIPTAEPGDVAAVVDRIVNASALAGHLAAGAAGTRPGHGFRTHRDEPEAEINRRTGEVRSFGDDHGPAQGGAGPGAIELGAALVAAARGTAGAVRTHYAAQARAEYTKAAAALEVLRVNLEAIERTLTEAKQDG